MTNGTEELNGGQQEAVAKHERWIHLKESVFECGKGAVELGGIALKTVILINGAAAVAVLAFITQLWQASGEQPAIMTSMVGVMSGLVVGVFAGALATGLGYLRMYFEGWYLHREIEKVDSGKAQMVLAIVFQVAAIILVIYAYIRFGVAMYQATAALVPAGGP
ncbi:MAG: hypothetical protein IIA72_05410 [Proteobacteria bacterium]|nr:hypothetical protein [Pseudomonadota bacterium]